MIERKQILCRLIGKLDSAFDRLAVDTVARLDNFKEAVAGYTLIPAPDWLEGYESDEPQQDSLVEIYRIESTTEAKYTMARLATLEVTFHPDYYGDGPNVELKRFTPAEHKLITWYGGDGNNITIMEASGWYGKPKDFYKLRTEYLSNTEPMYELSQADDVAFVLRRVK